MLSGSINYGSNLAYLVTFFLGGIWLTAILHTWRNLLGLTLSPLQVSPVFAGQEAGFKILLDNPSGLDRFGITLNTKGGSGESCDLANNTSRPLKVTLSATHRGELKLNDVSIHSQYPLGLFHAWTYARLDMICLIYPKPADRGEPPTEPVYNQSEAGDRGGGADDFTGLRSFRHGDSPRHIDWKVLARERGLYSKQFGGDRNEQISLDWDLLSDADPELRLSRLCRYILRAHEQQMAYGLKLPGTAIPLGRDEIHKHNCLSSLARFKVAS